MTKKDYILIADVCYELRPNTDKLRDSRWFQVVTTLAAQLKYNNPRFDFDKFYKKAGLIDG